MEANLETLRTRLTQVADLRDAQGLREDHRALIARLTEVEKCASVHTLRQLMTKILRLESMVCGEWVKRFGHVIEGWTTTKPCQGSMSYRQDFTRNVAPFPRLHGLKLTKSLLAGLPSSCRKRIAGQAHLAPWEASSRDSIASWVLCTIPCALWSRSGLLRYNRL